MDNFKSKFSPNFYKKLLEMERVDLEKKIDSDNILTRSTLIMHDDLSKEKTYFTAD